MRHAQRLRRHRDFIDFFPRPFEIRPARPDHAHLRINVAQLFVLRQRFGDGIAQRRHVRHAVGAAKNCLHRALVLVDRVKPARQITQQEPDDETQDAAKKNSAHKLIKVALFYAG